MRPPGEAPRVALFLPSLHGGGAERVMAEIANRLARRGNAVELVLARAEGVYLDEIEPSVRVVDLRQPRTLRAAAPLGNMFGYVNGLRSITQGRATFTMQFDHYAPVPDAVAAELIRH